jgi:Disulphide bond corrector protein DsbC
MKLGRMFCGAVFYSSLIGNGFAQGPAPQPVQWKALLVAEARVKQGARVSIDVTGKVDEGWHVYALTQPSGGPIALRVSLDENAVAESHGPITGTEPIKRKDPSFDLETQTYQGDFVLHVPIALKQGAGGNQLIPLSVRFQACSDRTCLPPRTVHLSVPIEVVQGN